jgi:hypothetical protein
LSYARGTTTRFVGGESPTEELSGKPVKEDESEKDLLMKKSNSRFDMLVSRYYPAVYGLAVKLTEDPRAAVGLTRAAFRNAEPELTHLTSKRSIANTLLTAVLRAGLATA